MNPVIIAAVGCHVCGVKAGVQCIDDFEGQNGHGDRMDVFRVEASYEDRLKVHIEGQAFFDTMKVENPERYAQFAEDLEAESETGSLWLTAKEIRALRASS
jgi:hypothetical protein